MRRDEPIPRYLQEKVDRELESGERVEWMETPVPRHFTPKATSLFLFGIPWTAFSIFWMCGAAGFRVPDFDQGFDLFAFFGLPFVLIGFGMLSAPYWAYRRALNTVYVVTDRRAITFDGGWSTTIRSYPPEKLQDVYRKERRNGIGDVVIARRMWRDTDNGQQSEELGFLNVRDPKVVEDMLKKLAEEGRQG